MESIPWRLFLHCTKTFRLLMLAYWSLLASIFINRSFYYVTMATLIFNGDRVKLVKTDIKPNYSVKFILFGKIDMKYEISVSQLISPPNFSLIPPKIVKVLKSWTLTLKTKNDVLQGPVVTSSILLWFWRKFVTYLHTTKFCYN